MKRTSAATAAILTFMLVLALPTGATGDPLEYCSW